MNCKEASAILSMIEAHGSLVIEAKSKARMSLEAWDAIILDLEKQEQSAGVRSKGIYKRIREEIQARLGEIEE